MSDSNVAVTIEDISSVQKKISFEIPWNEISKELDHVYAQVGKTARIKGFRPGKVPRKMLETYYKDHAEGEVISNVVNKVYWDAIKSHDIAAVSEPVVDQKGIEANKNYSFSAMVEVEPVINPKDYDGLELTREEKIVSEKDIEARIQQIREMFGTLEEIKEQREVRQGDFATFDFEGFVDGKPAKNMKSDGYFLEVGSNTFVPGFEEQLIGMLKGDHKQITVTFPEGYHSQDLAGKEVNFAVDLKDIREKKLPEINEEFIKNFEKYESLDAFKADLQESLEEENKAAADSMLKNQIIEKILEKNDFDVPPSFVERQIFLMAADAQRRLTSRGMEQKAAAQLSLKYHDEFKSDATKLVKSVLLIKKIAEKESITVQEEELQERIDKLAKERKVSLESMKESMEKEDMIDNVRLDVLNDKVFNYITEKAKITSVNSNATNRQEEK